MRRPSASSLSRCVAADGFTLVELLVAMAVLVLLVAMVTQLTNSAGTTITNSGKSMDADSQARLIFDRMANDFAKMVKRTDIDYVFCKSTGTPSAGTSGFNDAMFFYSEAPAYYDNTSTSASSKSTVALVGYRVNSKLQLERLGKGLTWDGATNNSTTPSAPGSMIFLTSGSGGAIPLFSTTIAGDGSTANPGNWTTIGTVSGSSGASSAFSDGTDSDYHVLAEQAYRLSIAFLLTDGTVSTRPILPSTLISGSNSPTSFTTSNPVATNDSIQGYAVGSRWCNTSSGQGYICADAAPGAAVWNRIGIQDISAIIVGIGILDTTSRKIVTSTNALVGALPSINGSMDGTLNPPMLMAQVWGNAITSSNFATASGIPPTAASQVRIYQRYFYLPATE
jgi:prepilin-type N-terminal cleavage/methylation domain-containing protein